MYQLQNVIIRWFVNSVLPSQDSDDFCSSEEANSWASTLTNETSYGRQDNILLGKYFFFFVFWFVCVCVCVCVCVFVVVSFFCLKSRGIGRFIAYEFTSSSLWWSNNLKFTYYNSYNFKWQQFKFTHKWKTSMCIVSTTEQRPAN